ncbi:MAG: PadR family transcriptional regulator [Candidatus Hydrothermarchaeaceae archaeon]
MSANKHNDLGLLQMQILWILGREPMHGYEMMKKLNRIKTSKVEQGTLYPALQRLEGYNLIRVKELGGRGKKTYELTGDGKEAMAQSCTEFSRTFSGIFIDFFCKSCKEEVS